MWKIHNSTCKIKVKVINEPRKKSISSRIIFSWPSLFHLTCETSYPFHSCNVFVKKSFCKIDKMIFSFYLKREKVSCEEVKWRMIWLNQNQCRHFLSYFDLFHHRKLWKGIFPLWKKNNTFKDLITFVLIQVRKLN